MNQFHTQVSAKLAKTPRQKHLKRRDAETQRGQSSVEYLSASLRLCGSIVFSSWRLGELGAIQPARTAHRFVRHSLGRSKDAWREPAASLGQYSTSDQHKT